MDKLERLAMLRELSESGWGGPGGPWKHGGWGGGRGGGPRGRGRRRRGDVRQAILLLLSEQPHNGYQLMQTIEERSGGRWRPSPGSVYPTLAQLEDEGLIRATEADGTKLFEITPAGQKQLADSGSAAAPWAEAEDTEGDDSPDLRNLIRGLVLAITQVAQAGNPEQTQRAAELLAQTRRELYKILAEEDDG